MSVEVKVSENWKEVADRTPSGAIIAFGGATAPAGWLICDGTAVSRATYADLFTAIGTTWGAGDESTTFNVPDLRGAFLRGAGARTNSSEVMANSSDYAGPSLGEFDDDQMQGHKHYLSLHSDTDDRIGIGQGANTTGGPCPVLVQSSFAMHHISDGKKPTWGGVDTDNRYLIVATPLTDGTNGTPRTGGETRPFAAGIQYIIKT